MIAIAVLSCTYAHAFLQEAGPCTIVTVRMNQDRHIDPMFLLQYLYW